MGRWAVCQGLGRVRRRRSRSHCAQPASRQRHRPCPRAGHRQPRSSQSEAARARPKRRARRCMAWCQIVPWRARRWQAPLAAAQPPAPTGAIRTALPGGRGGTRLPALSHRRTAMRLMSAVESALRLRTALRRPRRGAPLPWRVRPWREYRQWESGARAKACVLVVVRSSFGSSREAGVAGKRAPGRFSCFAPHRGESRARFPSCCTRGPITHPGFLNQHLVLAGVINVFTCLGL